MEGWKVTSWREWRGLEPQAPTHRFPIHFAHSLCCLFPLNPAPTPRLLFGNCMLNTVHATLSNQSSTFIKRKDPRRMQRKKKYKTQYGRIIYQCTVMLYSQITLRLQPTSRKKATPFRFLCCRSSGFPFWLCQHLRAPWRYHGIMS